jgi:hypothetical protein
VNHPPRAVFPQWPLLLREGERVLSDLARFTDINTIELSNFFIDWGETDSREAQKPPAPLALPRSADFGDLPVPVLDDAAFEGISRVLDLIWASGFSSAANVAPLYLAEPELTHLALVDITGKTVPAIRSSLAVYGCPNNPDARVYGEAMMRGFATWWPAADAITLNHVELPFWPQVSLSELFVCFCEACEAKAGRDGLDFERVRREVAAAYDLLTRRRFARPRAPRLGAADVLALLLERPLLAAWLNFRTSSMSDYVLQLAHAGRDAGNPELQIGLEFQAPAVSALVGTDFRTLAPLFDWLTPKFPDYLAAAVVPLIADEIAGSSGAWSADAVRAALRELLLLGRGPDKYEPADDPSEGIRFRNAFDPKMIELQLGFMGELGPAPTYPYLWQYVGDSTDFGRKVEAMRTSGFDGFFSWCWDRDLSTEALEAAAAGRPPA